MQETLQEIVPVVLENIITSYVTVFKRPFKKALFKKNDTWAKDRSAKRCPPWPPWPPWPAKTIKISTMDKNGKILRKPN